MDFRVAEIAQLLLELGAKVTEDVLYVEVSIDGYGIRFCKDLFAPELCADLSGKLFYSLGPGRELRSAEIILNGSQGSYYTEYRIHEAWLPRAFWDRAWTMAVRLREKVFDSGTSLVCTPYFRAEAYLEHRARPRRETYLLLRQLDTFIRSELEREREARRERNRKKAQAYARLFRLVDTAPHSLNTLKALGDVKVTRLTPDYWRVDCWVQGEVYSGWGNNPVSAAASLIRVNEVFLYRELGVRVAS
jgi:hypothetical protein